MAAAQSTGRLCSCGCGRTIENPRPDAKWSNFCRVTQERERKKLNCVRRNEEQRRATAPRQVTVRKSNLAEEANRRQKMCWHCFGMPWARLDTRHNEGRLGPEPVASEGRVCLGCGEPYAPEPDPPRAPVITSSAAQTARHGELHAVEIKFTRKEKNGGKV